MREPGEAAVGQAFGNGVNFGFRIQWQDAKAVQDGIHMLIVEGRAIVTFNEQRRAVLPLWEKA